MGQLLWNSNENIIVWVRVLMSLLFIGLVCALVHFYNNVWLKSEKLRVKLRMQGIKGPTPSFLYGNLSEMQKIKLRAAKSSSTADRRSEFVAHDYTSTVFPYFEHWRKEYGSLYTYSTGARQHLYINRPELVKEMNQSITLDLGKPTDVSKRLSPMLGNSILRSNGASWTQQRKIIAPEFYMDKVKGMVGLMLESTEAMVRKWEECIEANGGIKAEIKVDEDLRGLSADVISKACFGSSFTKGKEVFSKLRSLQTIIANQGFLFGSTTSLGIFGGKKKNEVSRYEKEIESLIWETIVEREQEAKSGRKDLLQLILEAASNDQKMDKEACKHFIVNNCKSMYFAGHESTAVAASWCLMLLALHPKWQDKIRAEIAEICPNSAPDADTAPHLKTVTMVIQEVLRLYPPAAFVSREALKETKIGSITVPKGVSIWTLIPTLHRDPDMWGSDANEFKPERFANGVAQAQAHGSHQAYFPFGIGPRLCVAKNFAMAELKVIIALIVTKFVFSLSPNYRHCPAYKMIVEPGHGVKIIVNKI